MPRVKKLTDYTYSPTKPASEDAIRQEIDNAIQEVYDAAAKPADTVNLVGNQTVAGIKTFSASPIVPAPTTDLQASTKKYVDDGLLANKTSDHEGTWQGYTPSQVDQTLRDEVVNSRTSSVYGAFANLKARADNSDVKIRDLAINVKDFGAIGDNLTDDTTSILNAMDYIDFNGGGVLFFPPGVYVVSRLPIYSNIIFQGSGFGNTYIRTNDLTSGYTFQKPDDGNRVSYYGFKDIGIVTALTSVSASQDVFLNVGGLNLCGCERGIFENMYFAGFGQSAITLARAEGGAEGLGFINTTQDGNYNTFDNIHIASCGKHNVDEAAIWLKYKANSNRFSNIYGKPVSKLFVIPHGNNNTFLGFTAETSVSLAYMGSLALGNVFISSRAENLSGDAFTFDAGSKQNFVIGGYHTGVVGLEYNLLSNENRVLSTSNNNLRPYTFPQPTNLSVNHNEGALLVTSINGDNNYPLYIKAENYNNGTYPKTVAYDTNFNVLTDQVLYELSVHNNDSSTGVKGENAKLKAIALNAGGKTGWSFETGVSGVTNQIVKIDDNLTIKDGLWNTPHLVMGTRHLWVDSTGDLRIKNGAPTSDLDGVVVGTQT